MALLCLCVGFAAVILVGNSGWSLQSFALRPVAAAVTVLDQPVEAALQVSDQTAPRALVLYSPAHEDSVQYEKTSVWR